MRISDWISDVCSSDLRLRPVLPVSLRRRRSCGARVARLSLLPEHSFGFRDSAGGPAHAARRRSEEHTSELQSLMRSSYAVFCVKNTTPAGYSTSRRCEHIILEPWLHRTLDRTSHLT